MCAAGLGPAGVSTVFEVLPRSLDMNQKLMASEVELLPRGIQIFEVQIAYD